jgi:hypothetical protein
MYLSECCSCHLSLLFSNAKARADVLVTHINSLRKLCSALSCKTTVDIRHLARLDNNRSSGFPLCVAALKVCANYAARFFQLIELSPFTYYTMW